MMTAERKMEIMELEMSNFVMRLEPAMRQRFNAALQKALIKSLMDGTVFAIVESLSDLQRMKETQLYNDRQRRLMQLQSVPDLEEQMRLIDETIVHELDNIVTHQQSTLSRAAVPAFHISSSPREIELQMAIISFILTVRSRLP